MILLDKSLPTPEENLALEEALLEASESDEVERLRFWESPRHFVVLGAGGAYHKDINIENCQAKRVPILRRCSGGGTVVQGPGCLNYTLALDQLANPGLGDISGTAHFVLRKIIKAVAAAGAGDAEIQGYSDLVIDGSKFSGNAQRRRKRFVLFHGTVLYGFDLSLISTLLKQPEKQPDYRANRPHDSFVRNVSIDPEVLKEMVAEQFGAADETKEWPSARTRQLAAGKYSDQGWITGL